MIRKAGMIATTVLLSVGHCNLALGQGAPTTILVIDIENTVNYVDDVADVSKFATDPNVTTGHPGQFKDRITIGDIVAVNGQAAKGLAVYHFRQLILSTNPAPGQAIADVARTGYGIETFEILKADGTPIGTITGEGLGVGLPPPGAPLLVTQGNRAILGGTGAFLGVRGQTGNEVSAQTVNARVASMTEDPANRRATAGGRERRVFHLIPLSRPEILATAGGPAVFHADFSPVTAARPAKAGEVLIVRATGLGPTVPGVNPGQPFPLDSLLAVNSPVDVAVNGQTAEVINAVGWPGLVDTYRLDFRVPDGTATGMAAIQLTAAWIAGSPVNIPIQYQIACCGAQAFQPVKEYIRPVPLRLRSYGCRATAEGWATITHSYSVTGYSGPGSASIALSVINNASVIGSCAATLNLSFGTFSRSWSSCTSGVDDVTTPAPFGVQLDFSMQLGVDPIFETAS